MSEKNDSPAINKYIHPPIVALFYIIVGILLGKFISIPMAIPSVIKNIGFGLICIGFLCGFSAIFEFRKARTTVNPHGSVSNIISSGIFRFTRNPIYLGFLLMVIGFPLAYGSLFGIFAAPLFVATMNRLVIEPRRLPRHPRSRLHHRASLSIDGGFTA